ncbi:MAG: c-type cytochrome [Kofleriaceae bacterium]
MRTILLIALVAACGGSKPAPAPMPEPTPVADPAPTPTEPAPAETPPAKPAPSQEDVLAASALAEQYEVGKAVYAAKKCNTCHEDSGAGNAKSPAVIGDAALPKDPSKTSKLRKGVTFTTAQDVFAFVKAKMPMGKGGAAPKPPLTDDEAYAVTAWMLDANKIALTKKLDAPSAATVVLRP